MTDTLEPETEKGVKNKGVIRYVPILLIATGFGAAYIFGLQDYLSHDALRNHKESLNALVDNNGLIALIGFSLFYATMIVLVPPTGLIMSLSGGFLFGTFWAGTAIVFGGTLGAVLLFLATRTAFGDVLRDRAGPAIQKMERGFQENAVSYMLFLRLVPLFPFFIVNIVPAFLGVPLRVFALTTAIGIIPATYIFASVGAGLGSIIEEQSLDAGLILEPQYLLPILGLAMLSLIPVVVKHRNADPS